jgi:hypothetical protein
MVLMFIMAGSIFLTASSMIFLMSRWVSIVAFAFGLLYVLQVPFMVGLAMSILMCSGIPFAVSARLIWKISFSLFFLFAGVICCASESLSSTICLSLRSLVGLVGCSGSVLELFASFLYFFLSSALITASVNSLPHSFGVLRCIWLHCARVGLVPPVVGFVAVGFTGRGEGALLVPTFGLGFSVCLLLVFCVLFVLSLTSNISMTWLFGAWMLSSIPLENGFFFSLSGFLVSSWCALGCSILGLLGRFLFPWVLTHAPIHWYTWCSSLVSTMFCAYIFFISWDRLSTL